MAAVGLRRGIRGFTSRRVVGETCGRPCRVALFGARPLVLPMEWHRERDARRNHFVTVVFAVLDGRRAFNEVHNFAGNATAPSA